MRGKGIATVLVPNVGIGRLPYASAEKGIDLVALGTAPAIAAQPAGLLHNVSPIAPTAGGGEQSFPILWTPSWVTR